jgi:hypothetical protein
LNAGLEPAGGDRHAERALARQFTLEVFDQDLVLSHDQHLGHRLVFEVSQGHAVLFEEFDQVLAGDASVLRAGDAVTFEATGIEPLADRARGHFTDLRDLSSCEDLHRRLSNTLAWCRCRSIGGEEPHDAACAPCLCLTGWVAVVRAGVGRCRPGSNIWVGADVLCFAVAWGQFLLIRALSDNIGNQGIRQRRKSTKTGEVLGNPARQDNRMLVVPTFGVANWRREVPAPSGSVGRRPLALGRRRAAL